MDIPVFHALVAAFLMAALFLVLPPTAVIVRKVRPIISAVGLIAWLSYRLFFGDCHDDPSLLDLVIMQVDHVGNFLTSTTSSFPTGIADALYWAWVLFEDLLAIFLLGAVWRLVYCVSHYSLEEWKSAVVDSIFEWSKQHIPIVKSVLQKYKAETREEIKKSIGKDPNRATTTRLPAEGMDNGKIIKLMRTRGATENAGWQEGKVSGAVYPADAQHTQLMQDAYAAFTWANPLHYGVWPTVNQFEAEIIAMTANMLHGNDKVVGTTSSGGTESIVLAIRAHREYYGTKRGITHPELLCGPTAHAAVDKACDMLGIRKVCVACDPEHFTLVPSEIEKRITCNTIMIYSSAPNFPQGAIDPIEELSKLALRYDIGLHVDACLGGFVLPFAKQLGHPIPKFDFECPGVTSMSVDTHKYAYASKGTSVVLYRHEDLRHAQYFSYSKWTGGLYITPTIAGSRPGALVACAWAALVSIGESGYRSRVKAILEASRTIANGIAQIPGIRLLMGNQEPTMIVCFDSTELDIYRVGGRMTKRGWELNSLQDPAAIHICVTMNTIPHVYKFIDELRASVEEVRKEGADITKSGTAAMYGMAGSLPAGPVNELLRCFTDEALAP